MPTFIRATTSGRWPHVDVFDIYGQRIGQKLLVMALEDGRWCIDSRPVDVIQGLIVSFKDHEAADYFLNQRRAMPVAVEPDNVVMFEDESDAMQFVGSGLGDRMSDREVQQMFEQQTASAADDDSEPDDGEGEEPQPAAKPAGKRKKRASG